MPFSRWNGISWVGIANPRRWDGAAWQLLQFVRRWSGTAWVDVWTRLTVSVSPSPSAAVVNRPGASGFVQSPSTTASAAGGTSPYTFNGWTRVSGSTNITANSPSSATTVFSGTVTDLETAVFRAQFTDSAGVSATADVEVRLRWNDVS